MKIKYILFIIVISICAQLSLLHSAISPELQSVADMYDKDNSDAARIALQKIVPVTDEEKALVLYYKAMLATDGTTAKAFLQQLCTLYPKMPVTQKAYLELGNLQLLDRDYTQALASYRKITDPAMPEKNYWIANTQNQMGDYANAISSAEMFLHSSQSTGLTEEAYFLVADAYINLNQYNNAVTTLNKLQTTIKILDDAQYFHYRSGYAYEMLGNRAEALSHYKQGYEINRYSQLAYLIEDQLFGMRQRFGSVIDLSFLYPFSDAPLPDIVVNNPVNGTNNTDINSPNTPSDSSKVQSKEISKVPDKGIFLQAGRFSSKVNAAKLSDRIAALGFNCQYYQATNYKDISWVVVCGPFETNQLATDARDNLKTNNIDSFIIQR